MNQEEVRRKCKTRNGVCVMLLPVLIIFPVWTTKKPLKSYVRQNTLNIEKDIVLRKGLLALCHFLKVTKHPSNGLTVEIR
jgi:hypothetical protein